MTAPSATVRQSPAGTDMPDGFSAKITFEDDPDISLWESSVTPPGIDGGDAIEQTTMHNTTWRTFAPRSLKTLSESTFEAGWDAWAYSQLIAMINVNQVLTVTFASGDTLAFWGFLRTFTPSGLVRGEKPMATCAITPTNRDDAGNEEAPVLTTVSTS